MADTYPTNDEYAKETLKSDGGPGDLIARTKRGGVAKAVGMADSFSRAGLKKSMRDNFSEAARELNKAGPGNILAASKSKKKKSKGGPR